MCRVWYCYAIHNLQTPSILSMPAWLCKINERSESIARRFGQKIWGGAYRPKSSAEPQAIIGIVKQEQTEQTTVPHSSGCWVRTGFGNRALTWIACLLYVLVLNARASQGGGNIHWSMGARWSTRSFQGAVTGQLLLAQKSRLYGYSVAQKGAIVVLVPVYLFIQTRQVISAWHRDKAFG